MQATFGLALAFWWSLAALTVSTHCRWPSVKRADPSFCARIALNCATITPTKSCMLKKVPTKTQLTK